VKHELEVAWAAGLFEGEGYMTGVDSNGNRGFLTISMGLEMTDRDVVERFHRIVGVGNVTTRDRRIKPHHKPQWIWRTFRHEDVLATMALFKPYFGDRRLARMEELLKLYEESRIANAHEPRPCKRCGEMFVPPHRSDGAYCSPECGYRAHYRRTNHRRAVRGYVRVALAKRQTKLF
jgi:hypothetical protein